MWGVLLSFVSGLLASFTPCVAVLFPITFYRFTSDKGTNYREYLLYVLGFIVTFILLGAIFQQLFNSRIQNGIKLAVALSLIVVGILEFMHKLNPLNLKPVKNTFLFGIIFALVVGINPCTLPYLGTIVGVSKGIEIMLKLIMFGIGVIIPPTLLIVFGNALLSNMRRVTKKISNLDRPMSIVLVLSGVYLGLHINGLSRFELIFSSLIVAFLLFIILRVLSSHKHSFKQLLNPFRLLLIIALFLLWGALTYHCYGLVGEYEMMCSATCTVCRTCMWMFSGSLLVGTVSAYLLNKFSYKRDKKAGD